MATKGFSPFSRKREDTVYSEVKNRDVYAEQNTERGDMIKPVSAKARIWAAVLICIGIFFGIWALVTLIMVGTNNVLSSMNMGDSGGTFWGKLAVYRNVESL